MPHRFRTYCTTVWRKCLDVVRGSPRVVSLLSLGLVNEKPWSKDMTKGSEKRMKAFSSCMESTFRVMKCFRPHTSVPIPVVHSGQGSLLTSLRLAYFSKNAGVRCCTIVPSFGQAPHPGTCWRSYNRSFNHCACLCRDRLGEFPHSLKNRFISGALKSSFGLSKN